MNKRPEFCPIMVAGANEYVSECIRKECAWWCDFADSCAIPLLAGMFADSDICRNIFEEGEK